MYIRTLHIRNFRGIPRAEFRFHEGLTVVLGPNETGKSTLLAAIAAALFTNADASSREAQSFRTWASQADPHVQMQFVAQDAEYTIEKTYLGEKKGRLRCDTTGLDTTNKDRINEEIARLLPVFNADVQSMRNTFWIEQQQLETTVQALQKDANLRSVLQSILLNSDGNMENVKKRVRKHVRELGVGTRGAAVKNPGPVARAEADAQRLRGEVAAMEQELATLQRDLEQQASTEQQLRTLRQQLQESSALLEAEKKYAEAQQRHTEANKALDAVVAAIDQYEKAHASIAALRVQLRDVEAQQKKTEIILDVLQRCEDIPKKEEHIRKGQEMLDAAREFDRRIADIVRQQHQTGAAIPKDRCDAARHNEQLVLRKREALAAAQIAVEIRAAQPIEITAHTDARTGMPTALQANQHTTHRANQKLRLVLDGIADISITSGVSNAVQLQAELEEAERARAILLREYKADTVAELIARFERQQELAVEQNALRRAQAERLGDYTIERIEAGVQKLRAEIEALQREYATLSLPLGETTTAWREKHTALVRQHTETTLSLRQCEETIQAFIQHYQTVEKAQERKLILAREAAKTETLLAELPRVDIPDHELLKLRRQHEQDQGDEQQLNNDYLTLTGRLQRATASSDALRLQQAKLEEAENLYTQYNTEFEAYKLIEVVIEESERDLADLLTEPVERIATTILPIITNGRYKKLVLDKNLRIVGVQYEGIEVQPETLSTGAQGQLALALRLALIHHIAGNERQTVIFDDAFVHFDAQRLQEAQKLLTRFAKNHQVLYLTCHDALRNWQGATVLPTQ